MGHTFGAYLNLRMASSQKLLLKRKMSVDNEQASSLYLINTELKIYHSVLPTVTATALVPELGNILFPF
jgi:hypothetical protein